MLPVFISLEILQSGGPRILFGIIMPLRINQLCESRKAWKQEFLGIFSGKSGRKRAIIRQISALNGSCEKLLQCHTHLFCDSLRDGLFHLARIAKAIKSLGSAFTATLN
jgi:hypothetical protein